jgi:hypothetical protein
MKNKSKQFRGPYFIPGHLSAWFRDQLHKAHSLREAKRQAKKKS